MINKPNNWDNVAPYNGSGGFTPLPPGGYVVRILDAETKTSASGYEYLELKIDIAEGEFTNYFKNEYDLNDFDNAKYKGYFRQGTPTDETRTRYFKAAIQAVEDSNQGYIWNWDEKSLIGRVVGCIFREEEWEYNGYSGIRTSAWRLTAADKIRKGEYNVPKPKTLQKAEPVASVSSFADIKDDDIPF